MPASSRGKVSNFHTSSTHPLKASLPPLDKHLPHQLQFDTYQTNVPIGRYSLRRKRMLAQVDSSAILGIDAYTVKVEVDISSTMPYFAIVGLPDAAVNESR